mmetsp:Transcript_15922/g.34466  ORF Transcript_15922/g.34466 Transcript_15922/m.34466 type:complete len:627 (+) Transcript_15922:307-2187(+)|eukprot:CAMPEP_0172311650 /NCGR_PEP_ID=MMETSP1058-20130122/15385_1 /TAXON_ID=83371 /ORGANISM="Detonula confervacea, Strain CCMP 353" /LENGTH=626 /DNA_ID=CAMNT_0013024911 /DNA_START=279 /DNA_END=2159 /DNA_ORIENTATION=-
MTPLHVNTEPSSRMTSGYSKASLSINHGREHPSLPCKRRRRSERRITTSQNNQCLLLFGLLLLSSLLQLSNAADGATECSSCTSASCTGSTIDDVHCGPCATGQSWWPCNILDECYCKDQAPEPEDPCELPLCEAGYSGDSIVPYTNCVDYVTCNGNGGHGKEKSCAPDQMYSTAIKSCNSATMVTCPVDPVCPGKMAPSVSPVSAWKPTVSKRPTYRPTVSERPSFAKSNGGGGNGIGGGGAASLDGAQTGSTTLNPAVLEGMYVMDAHMAANKIVLTRELLTSPGGASRGRQASAGASNDFSYTGFRSSLQTMITTPVANQTFYIGHSGVENGRAYGLVNIAAFLAMSVEDSISHGSCDEVNTDLVGGMLPMSNACGQNGLSYEDMTCPGGEEMYACDVDPNMMMNANPIDATGGSTGGGETSSPPKPLYCGPTTQYPITGHWDYVSGTEAEPWGTENGMGRKDVEGCCWWGRGSIQLRGTCAYGKLNYFLGKRAHDEGRPSMYPDVDFCRNPQAICSHVKYPNLKWIAGMFRWIADVQTYNSEEFNYMQRLVDFVDGGLQDWSFVHGVSGIVTQGCHAPPCYEGAEFNDGVERKATFIKTLRLLGLSVKDDGPTATGRRLGES